VERKQKDGQRGDPKVRREGGELTTENLAADVLYSSFPISGNWWRRRKYLDREDLLDESGEICWCVV